jgi:predicted RNA-binding protein YlxR (DUF448 family)
MEPVRTCIGCRQRAEKSALVRIIASDGIAVVDFSAVASGRGAWVHPHSECVATAVKRRAFGRALRTEVLDTHELVSTLTSQGPVVGEPPTNQTKAERLMDN